MIFVDLDSLATRNTINAVQTYSGFFQTKSELGNLRGSMYWRTISGQEYLIRDYGIRQTSLGRRSKETELILDGFNKRKSELSDRYKSLGLTLQQNARACVASYANRVPLLVAKLTRKLSETPVLENRTLIIGTNALFAYESAAAVRFKPSIMETTDVDVLFDTRKKISIASTEPKGIIGLLKSIDPTFEVKDNAPYSAQNKKGFIVDLVQPLPQKSLFSESRSVSTFPDDMSAVEIKGLDWLVSCPKFQAMVIDEKGYPAQMSVPDPRAFSMHKLWLSSQMDREPSKKQRDREQSEAVFRLVQEKLTYLAFNDSDLKAMPYRIREQANEDIGFGLSL